MKDDNVQFISLTDEETWDEKTKTMRKLTAEELKEHREQLKQNIHNARLKLNDE